MNDYNRRRNPRHLMEGMFRFNEDFLRHGQDFLEQEREIKDVSAILRLDKLRTHQDLNAANIVEKSKKDPVPLNRSQDGFITVRLLAFVPEACYPKGSHVRLTFFTKDFSQPILLGHSIEQERKACSKGDAMILITTELQLPMANNRENFVVYYYYTIETQINKPNLPESLLTEKESIRALDLFKILNIQNSNRKRRGQNEDSLNTQRIDGLVLFKNSSSLLDKANLKENIIELLLPVNQFYDQLFLDEPDRFKRHLSLISNVYRDLCKDNKDYASLFERKLVSNFEKILVHLRDKRNNQQNIEDWECLILLGIFYLSTNFELTQITSKPEVLSLLFGLHQTNKLDYYQKVNLYFKLNEYDKNLDSELEKFLNENNMKFNLTNGINALITLYYIKKSEMTSDFNQYFAKIDSNKLSRFILNKESDRLMRFIQANQNLVQNDPLLASLIINYFSATQKNLIDLYGNVPIESYLYYFSFTISKQYDQFTNKFSNENTPEFFNLIVKMIKDFVQNHLKNDLKRLIRIYEICSNLFDYIIEKFSKEFQLIINLIELIFNLINFLSYFNIDLQDISNKDILDETNENLKSQIQKWFSKEFSDSLLTCFGIEDHPKEQVENNTIFTYIYKNFNEIKQNLPFLNNNLRSIVENYQNPYEVKSLIVFHGLTNEHNVLQRLLNLKIYFTRPFLLKESKTSIEHEDIEMDHSLKENLKEFQKFLISNLFKHQLNKRANASYEEVVKFRIKFKFSEFSSHQNEFLKIANTIISQHLIDSTSDKELATLCKCLSNKEYQHVLDYFINELLSLKWPKSQETYDEIKFALEWFLFIDLIKIHTIGQSLPLNNQKWFQKYENLINNFKKIIQDLIDSNVTLNYVKLISNNLQSTENLNSFLIDSSSSSFSLNQKNKDFFKALVQSRVKELKKFEIYKISLEKFSQICLLFERIKIDNLRKQLDYLQSLNKLDFVIHSNEICKSIDFNEQICKNSFNLDTYSPTVVYFKDVDENFMKYIVQIISLNRAYCVIFDDYFKESCDSLSTDLQLSEFIKTAWDKTYERLSQITMKIDSAEIKLIELDQILKTYFNENFQKMENELFYLIKYFDIKNFELRKKQILLYSRFKTSYSTANEIEKIRQGLRLSNQFPELDDLLSIKTDKYLEWNLNRMDDKVKKTIDVMERINDTEKLKCLFAYSESLQLVEWLRTNTKDLVELKVLVDLASMSTSNQSEHGNFDRTLFAKALKEAGVAFASLIYNLTSDVTFFEFIELSEKVFSHLEIDRNIANKLLEVKDKVELLDEIKRMKGSVEMNSLKQVKQINESGLFKIGVLKVFNQQLDEEKLIQFNQKMNLNDLIELEIDGTDKKYSFEQLKELQNILMLIVPRKGQISDNKNEDDDETETLEYFMEMFSGVIRLVEAYQRMLDNCCLFFENLVVQIYCDFSSKRLNNQKANIKIYIKKHNDNNLPVLIEDKSNKSLDCLKNIYSLMELTFDQWSNFIKNLRDNNLFLNFFNLNQIKFLIKAFNKLLIKNQLNSSIELEMIISILFNINSHLDKDKIIKAYENSLKNRQSDDVQIEDVAKTDKNQDQIFSYLFEKTWNEFLNEQNSIETDFISLKNLALILNFLNEQNIADTTAREIPGYLNNLGKPNLIICPLMEQIQVILSIYGLSITQPPPTNNEILFCQQNTTSEELENFLRIVFKSNGEQIYTLVNIEELTYDNSTRIEKFLKNYENKSEKFVLVFICTEGKESESILASSYLKNRVRPVLIEQHNLDEYLKRILFDKQDNKLFLKNYDPNHSSVRVLFSQRSGNGKSKYVKYLCKKIAQEHGPNSFNYKTIRIKSNSLQIDDEIEKLLNFKQELESQQLDHLPTIYHIDIAYEVFKNVDYFLFSLIVECYLKHSCGLVWRRDSSKDLYLIEITPPIFRNNNSSRIVSIHSMINFLPKLELRTPAKYLYDLKNVSILDHDDDKTESFDNLFSLVHKKEKYQRLVFYMKQLNNYRVKVFQRQTSEEAKKLLTNNLDKEAEAEINTIFDPNKNIYDEYECLDTIIQNSELADPNWHEIRNYATFLNSQLILYEKTKELDTVVGLRSLCLGLLLVVANNFGSPSLNYIATERASFMRSLSSRRFDRQESLTVFEFNQANLQAQISLNCYEIREDRKWENMIYPFMIINSDCTKITFIGTFIDRTTKQLINPNTREPLSNKSKRVPRVSKDLFIELLKKKFPLFDNFNEYYFEKKLGVLKNLMCLNDQSYDHLDESYELTLDNCLKIIAIYLRFLCNIPVIVMGETGCGKTSLVKYFSELHKNSFEKILIHFKIHGGTTANDIKNRLEEAENLSRENYRLSGAKNSNQITTILFFDEANTTEEVGLIKEIMCDFTCMGRKIDMAHGLKLIAAVNPYRKHSQEMIEKLESAGLGFYVSSSDTKERLGHIPMRQLVYRVQPLPTSLMPIVWDFGQLDKSIESVYVSELIKKSIFKSSLIDENNIDFLLICDLLNKSQNFMRERNDECSFVSIRNIERVIKVTNWFVSKSEFIFQLMNKKTLLNVEDYSYESKLSSLRRSFVLSLIVCYHACLYNNETRKKYRKLIMDSFAELEIKDERIESESDWVFTEMLKCQSVFFDEINLNKKNIACNLALFENVFMMIICIELRIPLFIVGKPGSSKSLAKTIVSRAMEGRNSKSKLFQNLKETYFVNFQCSPLTTSEMILKAFEEAAKFQESVDIQKSVAVVNLDEIGLAEGSESMPLKALHPLLESGTDSAEENVSEHHKVAVVGISNWALDPAKMNRGLFVSRGEPDVNELIETAKGICRYDKNVLICIEPFLPDIAEAYLELCQTARDFKREFFGLRDYYSLIKMIFFFCSKDQIFTWSKLQHAVLRNFSGLEIDNLEPFKKRLINKLDRQIYETDPKCEPLNLVESALKGEYVESNSRYLLFLTENNSAIDIIQNYLVNMVGISAHNLSVIFGSSFRLDQQYTEVCRNISLIKHSMEIGKTIILLNSYNLYESLYDALNQYYYEFAGQKYVDLGLGTHRIKCSVHDSFRLIIIAEKSAVYDSKRFPIPLINRLEKHFLNSASMLNSEQVELADKINSWMNRTFCNPNVSKQNQLSKNKVNLNENFIGFHSDTIPSLVLHLSAKFKNLEREELIEKAKKYLLKCATPDCIIRENSIKQLDSKEKDFVWKEYFSVQQHLCLKDMLKYHFNQNEEDRTNLIQITTHSKSTILNLNIEILSQHLDVDSIDICLLQSFDTQQQFLNKLKQFVSKPSDKKNLLMIQSEINLKNSYDLIGCARHHIIETFKEMNPSVANNYFICVIILIPREKIKNFIGYQFGYWSCYHLDEIDDYSSDLPPFESLSNKPLSKLLEEALDFEKPSDSMEIEETSEVTNLDLRVLFKKLAHSACSLLVDTNLSRTIHRIDLFIKLCDNRSFLQVLTQRLIKLQTEKENNFISKDQKQNWLISEVASSKQIKQYSTFRRACQSYLESKFSPLLAFILSNIDLYSNLDTFYDGIQMNDSNWKADLWLSLFENEDLCKIVYSDMRSKEDEGFSKELNSFSCQSEWIKKEFTDLNDENKKLKPSLPFFWLLNNQLTNLYKNFTQSVSAENGSDLNTYAKIISNFFGEHKLYQLLKEILDNFSENSTVNLSENLIDCYINDFLLINTKVPSKKCLDLSVKILKTLINELDDRLNLKYILPMIHYIFEKNKFLIENFLKFSSFEPNLIESNLFKNESYFSQKTIQSIDLDACLEAVKLFKLTFTLNCDNLSLIDRVFILLQLIDELLINKSIKNEEDKQKLIQINEQYQALTVLKCFVDVIRTLFDEFDLIKRDESHKSVMIDMLKNQLDLLNNRYFNENINFKDKNSILNLHDFLIESYKMLKDFIRKDDLDKVEEILNTFYINVIEKLCFDQTDSKPDNQAIEVILKAITDSGFSSSRNENLKNITFNLKFIYRSLLIQIVLKNFNDNLISYLNNWFNSTGFIGGGGSQNELFASAEELSIIFQNCVFDQYINQFSKYNNQKQLVEANELCVKLLNNNNFNKIFSDKKMVGKAYDVSFLLDLSKIKFCINILSKFSYSESAFRSIEQLQEFNSFENNMKSLIEYTMKKANTKTNTLINYLLKDLIRKFGSSSINYIVSNEKLNWMTPLEIIGNSQSVTDRYVLIGDTYLKFRKATLECFKTKNFEPLKGVIQEYKKPIEMAPYICLNIYQNITLLNKSLDNLTSQIADIISPFIDEFYSQEKNLIKPLLNNSFTNEFKVNDLNWSNIDLTLLLVQIKYSIIFNDSSLIKPLKELILNPSKIADQYLPTMPQDDLYEIKIVLHNSQSDANRFYMCPNGHIYVIGNCGRAWVRGKCNVCGEEIGGEGHNLVKTNKMVDDTIQDKTMKGYCISEDNRTINNIRSLSSTTLHFGRFFLNTCMYLACGDNDENIDFVKNSMAHQVSNVREFFFKEIKNELNVLCKLLNLTLDEIIILLHTIVAKFLDNDKKQIKIIDFYEKNNRQIWETEFTKEYISPIMITISECLKISNIALKEKNSQSGDRDDQSKMYFMAYELVTEDKTKSIYLYENEKFWKYRPNMSFDLMAIEFGKINTNKFKYSVLNTFIQSNYELQLLINLEPIVKLVKFLNGILNRSILKYKARSISIKEFIANISLPKEWSQDKIEECVKSFQSIWSYSNQNINDYIRSNISSDLSLSISFTFKFDMNTKLSYLLPTKSGDGLLCYSLIHMLSKIQNDMLEKYYSVKKIENFESKHIDLFDNKELLINFNKNEDLLRIVLSNFSYDSKNLEFLFRYDNIEHQIIDKYFRSKALINYSTIPIFEFSDEINDFSVFKRLNEQTKQNSLELSLQLEIMKEFTEINEISEALNTLKIIINYAIATSAQPNEYISSFLRKIYTDYLVNKSEEILKIKIVENCKLANLKQIWIILMMKLSILYTLNDQDPFEKLNQEFKEECKIKLELDLDKSALCSLTAIIYQIITFVLISLQGDDQQTYSQIKIQDIFYSMDDLSTLIILDKYKIPEEFFDEKYGALIMRFIYSIWKQLCYEWTKN